MMVQSLIGMSQNLINTIRKIFFNNPFLYFQHQFRLFWRINGNWDAWIRYEVSLHLRFKLSRYAVDYVLFSPHSNPEVRSARVMPFPKTQLESLVIALKERINAL